MKKERYNIGEVVTVRMQNGEIVQGGIEDRCLQEYSIRTPEWRTKKWYRYDEIIDESEDSQGRKGDTMAEQQETAITFEWIEKGYNGVCKETEVIYKGFTCKLKITVDSFVEPEKGFENFDMIVDVSFLGVTVAHYGNIFAIGRDWDYEEQVLPKNNEVASETLETAIELANKKLDELREALRI